MRTNYTQKITTYRSGDQISASEINKIVDGLFSRIKAGTGVVVRRIGQNVIVDSRPFGKGGNGGGSTIPTVEELPPIPTNGTLAVFWTSAGDGNGDDQVWEAGYNDTDYAPRTRVSNLSGTPL